VDHGARSIVLIGMMGAGKSSVGRCLERRTGLQRFDIDDLVVAHVGRSIPQIFTEFGEAHFRDAETDVLAALNPRQSAIVVTGGGVVLRRANVSQLKRLGLVVWLDANEEVLLDRATRRRDRPLLERADPKSAVAKLISERAPLYAAVADLRIDTSSLTHEQVSELILAEVEKLTCQSK
jgi:shikimate kinase